MTPEEEQKIRNLLKVPPTTTSDQVAAIYDSVKDFLLATSSVPNTKPLSEATLSKLYAPTQAKSKTGPTSSTQSPNPADTSPQTPPPAPSQSSVNAQPGTASDTTTKPITDTNQTAQLNAQLLQVINQALPVVIFVLLIAIAIIAYNKFVTAPEAKRQAIEKLHQEIIYKKETDDKLEAAKKAECDQIQASVAGNVDMKEQARQRRYKALEQADPNQLPLVPHISDLRRELSELDDKIKLLDGTSQSNIDIDRYV